MYIILMLPFHEPCVVWNHPRINSRPIALLTEIPRSWKFIFDGAQSSLKRPKLTKYLWINIEFYLAGLSIAKMKIESNGLTK